MTKIRFLDKIVPFSMLLFVYGATLLVHGHPNMHIVNKQNTNNHNYNSADQIFEELFQNRTNFLNSHEKQYLRQLGIVKEPYNPNSPVSCVVCRGMSYCPIIDSYMIQEVYYPKNPTFLESCKVLDLLGEWRDKLA